MGEQKQLARTALTSLGRPSVDFITIAKYWRLTRDMCILNDIHLEAHDDQEEDDSDEEDLALLGEGSSAGRCCKLRVSMVKVSEDSVEAGCTLWLW